MSAININNLVDMEATTPRADHFSRQPPSDQAQSARPDTKRSTPTLPQQQSKRSRNATPDDDDDEAMDIDDAHEDDSDGEDEVDGEGGSRKKKGQRFFCTQYPPCNLSFTRSEHLARHIRKHTGERPFQCHCNRRFSRLDNLRQHAQTVHVNEEIPGDSLAATGTRFQRQIRTERVRQGPRPRSGTAGSTTATGGHTRGHSRNLSNSSIGSAASGYSTVIEAKRRPPPLLMANESSRPRLGLDAPRTPPPGYYNAPQSPSGLSTPTSATFSAAPGSPAYMSSYGSPPPTHSRMNSLDRTHHRRLSVPSGLNPYQSLQSPYGQSASSSIHSSVYGSPTTPTFPGGHGQYYAPGEDPRRRTWHPTTINSTTYNYGRPATSGLSYSQTPDAPQPAYAQHATAAASQGARLPGIETFDDTRERRDRGLSPPRRAPSPVHPGSNTLPFRTSEYPPLDDNGQIARPGSWGQQTIDEIQRVGGHPGYPPAPYQMAPPPAHTHHPQHMAQEALHMSGGKQTKRQGWYSGPQGTRTSPEDSSSSEGIPTPGTSSAEIHPVIMPSSGFIEPQHHMVQPDGQNPACLGPAAGIPSAYADRNTAGERSSTGGEMNRLEALVAVATRDESAR